MDIEDALVPDLTPRQFKRFFALSELDVFIDQSLPALRRASLETYADVISQLEGSTSYNWRLAKHFMAQLMRILPTPPPVDFEQLKALWIAQSEHHLQI